MDSQRGSVLSWAYYCQGKVTHFLNLLCFLRILLSVMGFSCFLLKCKKWGFFCWITRANLSLINTDNGWTEEFPFVHNFGAGANKGGSSRRAKKERWPVVPSQGSTNQSHQRKRRGTREMSKTCHWESPAPTAATTSPKCSSLWDFQHWRWTEKRNWLQQWLLIIRLWREHCFISSYWPNSTTIPIAPTCSTTNYPPSSNWVSSWKAITWKGKAFTGSNESWSPLTDSPSSRTTSSMETPTTTTRVLWDPTCHHTFTTTTTRTPAHPPRLICQH